MFLKRIVLLLIFALLLTGENKLMADFKSGETYHGFKLLDKKFVSEVNSECLYFQHEKSGARLLKIAADDANKTFSIAFKTIPNSDAGTPHILEHAVLNGSKNFPVKSPFDVLAKGSLNTFLNAMTGDDITIYPVASMNDKDFFNLMHIYLDAVFNPLIYEDPRILRQEGWHHELEAADKPVVYKGVVYNEMKGAFSSPTRELGYQVANNLFPDNGYHFTSGGYPSAIPTLTHEAFLDFHRTFYHPGNSYIYLYGNADLDKELEFIDREYLSAYERSDKTISILLQKPFAEMKKVTAYYSASEGGDTEDQTYLTLNYVTGLNTDEKLLFGLRILREVLVNQESAPVRLALQQAGIGKEVGASLDDIKQNVFQIRVQNANPQDRDRFYDVVRETLQKVAVEGLDKEAVEGTLNRIEFRLREGDDAQKGLTYNFQARNSWFFAGDPFISLEYEKPLAAIKKAIKSGYLEDLIKKYMLGNTHALLLVLEPKPGLEKENSALAEKELLAFKESLSAEQISALVKETEELVAYQEREDSEESLATIPLLDLKDINPEAAWYEVEKKEFDNLPGLFYETFTNDVVYGRFYFDTRVLPAELIPYSGLLAEVLGSLNTKNYTFGELDKALDLHTGGFETFVAVYLEELKEDNPRPNFIVSAKAMNNKVGKMFELTGEILNNTIYNDRERLKDVLTRHQSRLDSDVKRNGLGYARTRLFSYYSDAGMYDELTGGAEYYWFVTDLIENFDKKADQIIENLGKTAGLLFSSKNLVSGMTGAQNDRAVFVKNLRGMASTLNDAEPAYQEWTFESKKKNEGLKTASKVQYVVQGYDFKKLGYKWDGRIRVLNQVLSRDWLTKQIRVIGGAYGGFSSFSPSGRMYFGSYRDPNLTETLENYDATPGYLKSFEADEKDMTRYIIGTVARLDRPLTPSQRGIVGFRRWFEKTTKDLVQKEREAVLATTAQDIRDMEKMISDLLAQDAICVYGNEEKIEAAKEVFSEVIDLAR